MSTELPFISELHDKIQKSLKNDFGADNWDLEVLGNPPTRRVEKKPSCWFRGIMIKAGFGKKDLPELGQVYRKIVTEFGAGLNNLYQMLDDDASRRTLIEVMAYRILGHRAVWLGANNETYWRMRESASALPHDNKGFVHPSFKKPTSFYDLGNAGFPIIAYGYPPSLTHTFLSLHYDYEASHPQVAVREGDCVIDAGACWGDTSLLFARRAGETGKVYAFEFDPQNLEIIDQCIQLNEALAPRISVIQKALWNESGKIMRFNANGPSTRLSSEDEELNAGLLEVETITIDDLCLEIGRIDFIKMDIEGAELPALQGAAATIKKFKPTLAISLYHSLSDFVTIPKFLQTLDIDYAYYLKHPTIFDRETVLFASPK